MGSSLYQYDWAEIKEAAPKKTRKSKPKEPEKVPTLCEFFMDKIRMFTATAPVEIREDIVVRALRPHMKEKDILAPHTDQSDVTKGLLMRFVTKKVEEYWAEGEEELKKQSDGEEKA